MPETNRGQHAEVNNVVPRRFQMTAFIQTIAKGTAKANSEFETLVQLGLFSGLGLLISVGIILLDKYMPGEWF